MQKSKSNEMLTYLIHTEHGDEEQSNFRHFFGSFYLFCVLKCTFKRHRDDVYEITTEFQLNRTNRCTGTLNSCRSVHHHICVYV